LRVENICSRRLTIYAYFNNHYAGFGPASARAFNEMLDRTIGKRNAETATRSCPRAAD